MAEVSYMRARDLRPPQLRHSVMEFGRVVLEMGSTAMLAPVLQRLPAGMATPL